MNTDETKQPPPEHHHDRQNRSKLNHHFECLGRIAFKPQQMTHNNHMARAGYRQKLRQSFDHTQNCRYQQRVHIAHQ
ncbi:Uncharacterised protein [Salmonella enterica subsp. enterica serovar Bovismorbificans]|uniref:Uncharacterized protein n=1 Tax=Salmonella enterica subsp. enterica serovar Bovismorbificans TaxID=58097 RepID=A0A655BXS6_SALET|nr:Uncharacterised protein [Salmonella enterica subsp. enterica serovar Bovismorbificans]